MGLRLIRQESETPNVSNHDDARMARYAYGGYDGYVKNRGQEIGHTISGTSFVVQSGVLNLQGWEVEIDANGVSIPTSASVTNKTYFSVYLEVNCATDEAEIKSLTDPAGFPDVPAGDDLTENTIGTARLLLYHFTATSGVIADVEKLVQEIPYGKETDEAQNEAFANAQAQNNRKFSEIDSEINVINRRLQNLGFRQGYAAFTTGPGGITLKRQGNYVLAEFYTKGGLINTNDPRAAATIPSDFRPRSRVVTNIGVMGNVGTRMGQGAAIVTIGTDGSVDISNMYYAVENSNPGTVGRILIADVRVGWEAVQIV